MWTPTELSSEAHAATGDIWRAVEHQYTAASRKLVDTQDEQDVLEDILEESKPRFPPGTQHLHYLLKTPFRYDTAYPHGSRFRKAGFSPGVYYASEQLRTALAEFAHHRLRFFQSSPQTPFPKHRESLSLFSVRYHTRRQLDLTVSPFSAKHALWTQEDYSHTQLLAETALDAGIEAIRYVSVRDPEWRGQDSLATPGPANLALLSARAFARHYPENLQTWYFYMAKTEVNFMRAHPVDAIERWTFPVATTKPVPQAEPLL